MSSNLPALARTVADICDEYDAKIAALPAAIAALEKAWSDLEMASTVAGTFADSIGSSPRVSERSLRRNLLKSGWKAIYNRLNIDQIASASDRRLFEQTLQDPPPLEFETARSTFMKYLVNQRFHILRGLAECFVDLDPAYKSHSKVKIGVAGLPKRVIIGNWGQYGTGWGVDRARDVFNALAAYRGEPVLKPGMMHTVHTDTRNGQEVTLHDITVRRFQNGNVHLIFEKAALLDINRALAEFYGDVLPDAEPDEAERRPGTEVAKDLQFYPTPQPVIETILDEVGIYTAEQVARYAGRPVYRILEPSCGDGRILDAIRDRGHSGFGFEVHAGRAEEARARGHAVKVGNFLEAAPNPTFDFVVMNPPFYGRHYIKHIRHALRFLKPGGCLVSVLPASAWYDHDELADLKGRWRDLPVASFAESGTNIPTGFFITSAPR